MPRNSPPPPAPHPSAPPPRITVYDARLIYRNFSGHADRYNEPGNRNFSIVLDQKMAEQFTAMGLNVRCPTPANPDYDQICLLKIQVKYRARDGRALRPPRVMLITTRGKTPLNEESVELLDTADIIHVDLMFSPWEYDPGKYSAYLYAIYVTIREDELELAYLDVPDTGQVATIRNQGPDDFPG